MFYDAKWIIIVAAVIAVVIVILQQMEVPIPPFIIKILWIILAAVVGIMALRFLMSL